MPSVSQKRLFQILWARIAAATVLHGLISAVVFELCSLSLSSLLALFDPRFTLLRLKLTLAVVLAQCAPVLARVILGQTGDARHWGLLRCGSAPRRGFGACVAVAQGASSAVAALVFAWGLLSAVEINATFARGAAVGSAAALDTRPWWQIELVLLSAVAAVVCDTARSFRRSEHDLTFPALPGRAPELRLTSRLAGLTLDGARSALGALGLACLAAWVALPALAGLAGWGLALGTALAEALLGPSAARLGLDLLLQFFVFFPAGIEVGTGQLSVFFGTRPPLAVAWLCLVAYGANYLLLAHAPQILKALLGAPIDFERLAGGGGSSVGGNLGSNSDDTLGSDGRPASELMVTCMLKGWYLAVLDMDAQLATAENENGAGDLLAGDDGYELLSSGGLGEAAGEDTHSAEWCRVVLEQRRAVAGLLRRAEAREGQALLGRGGGFGAQAARLWGDMVHCGSLGVNSTEPPPLRPVALEEQDQGLTLLDSTARALAFQSVFSPRPLRPPHTRVLPPSPPKKCALVLYYLLSESFLKNRPSLNHTSEAHPFFLCLFSGAPAPALLVFLFQALFECPLDGRAAAARPLPSPVARPAEGLLPAPRLVHAHPPDLAHRPQTLPSQRLLAGLRE